MLSASPPPHMLKALQVGGAGGFWNLLSHPGGTSLAQPEGSLQPLATHSGHKVKAEFYNPGQGRSPLSKNR